MELPKRKSTRLKDFATNNMAKTFGNIGPTTTLSAGKRIIKKFGST